MQPADLEPRQLVGLGGAQRGLHDAVQNVPVELGRPGLALGSHVFGHEPVRQFGHRGRAAFGGLLARRVVPVRHRAQDDLGARSGALRRDLPDCRDGVAPHRRAAPCARPVDDHVGLRAGRAHPHAEAGHSVIPYGELAAVGLQGIHRALGDSLGWSSARSLLYPVGATPGQHRNGMHRNFRIAA